MTQISYQRLIRSLRYTLHSSNNYSPSRSSLSDLFINPANYTVFRKHTFTWCGPGHGVPEVVGRLLRYVLGKDGHRDLRVRVDAGLRHTLGTGEGRGGLGRALDTLVLGVLGDAPGHTRTPYLRQVELAAHAGRVGERLLVLGHHRVLYGRWRLIGILGAALQRPSWTRL